MIRRAVHADIPRLVELGRELHAESRLSDLPFDESRVKKMIGDLIDAEHVGIPLVLEQDGEIVGGVMAMLCQRYFSTSWFAQNICVFITKDKRGFSRANRLFESYIEHASRLGADDIQFANDTGYMMEEVRHLAERHGFTLHGYVLSRKPQ